MERGGEGEQIGLQIVDVYVALHALPQRLHIQGDGKGKQAQRQHKGNECDPPSVFAQAVCKKQQQRRGAAPRCGQILCGCRGGGCLRGALVFLQNPLVGYHTARLQTNHAVGKAAGTLHVVRDNDDAALRTRSAQGGKYRIRVGGVKIPRRLVREQNISLL